MLVIPGFAGKDTCDGITRRDFCASAAPPSSA